MNAHFLATTPRWTAAGLALLAATACAAGADESGSASFAPNTGVDPNGSNGSNGSNVSLGGSQDLGFARGQIDAGLVPSPESLDAAGFFAEHHMELPPPACGERLCLQPMLGVMSNLIDGQTCTMLHVGLNSPISATPTERPPLSLAVVVDVSGSMASAQKIDFVKQGLELLVDGMKDDDALSIVTYSDGAEVVVPLAPVVGGRVALRSAIDTLWPEGSTNLSAGLELGYRQLLDGYDGGRQNRVILLSDGQPTAGIQDTDAILDLSRAYNSDGIGLTTIGLGADFNIDLMRGLALQADGNFYFLEDAGAVNEVFVEELSFFVVPVAYDVELSVRAGQFFDFGRAYGTPFWTNGAGGGSMSVPSVFIAHRESDADVTADGGRRGGGSQLVLELMPKAAGSDEPGATVATIDLMFREPGTNRIVTDVVDVPYPFPTGTVPREGFFDAPDVAVVQKSFVMLNIFVGLERVSQAVHELRATDETAEELDALIAAVEDYNDEVGDVDIAADLDMLRALRQNLRTLGIGVEPAPPAPDPWPAD